MEPATAETFLIANSAKVTYARQLKPKCLVDGCKLKTAKCCPAKWAIRETEKEDWTGHHKTGGRQLMGMGVESAQKRREYDLILHWLVKAAEF